MVGMRWMRTRTAGARRALSRWVQRALLPRARRIGLGHSSLRRRSDRLESAGLIAAWLLVLAVAPLAWVFGGVVHQAGLTDSATETATRHEVAAVVLVNVPFTSAPNGVTTQRLPANARWDWPSGVQHTGQIEATEGTTAGTVVSTWVDASGQPVDPPLTVDQALWRSIGAGTMSFGFACAGIWLAFTVFRRLLDRKRWADWETDWQRVGPQWTRHRR